MIFQRIGTILNPERFQGYGKTKSYFEGWYFKFLNADTTIAYAVIPGIAFDARGNGHSFIQVLDGKKHLSVYHKFEIQDFRAEKKVFNISIGDNHFSGDSLCLNLPGLKGELSFQGMVPWPKTFYSPGIMGPYAFAPFMECYHGIVSMDHAVAGTLLANGQQINFDGGRGYIEKDWGSSFPSAYFWLQSNHFSESGISLKTSVAKIPWIRNSFTGYIAGLWMHDRLYRFTTYNRTALSRASMSGSTIKLVFNNSSYSLELLAFPDISAPLSAPIRGAMEGRIEESMSSVVEVKLTEVKSGRVLLNDSGKHASLELAGDIGSIISIQE
jgi:tocopherol cyclase